MTIDIEAVLNRVAREEWGRVTATLVRDVGDLELAEDAVQDAVVAALEVWPRQGVPDRPGAWLTITARRKALDRLRRAASLAGKTAAIQAMADRDRPVEEVPEETTVIRDDELRLMFMCCHPALSLEAQVALTLRSLCGLTTAEIARAFLVPEPTLAQRLVRARRKVKVAGIPFRVPPDHLLDERLAAVLAVVYLVFNEGHRASEGDRLIRAELCAEAIRLARLLAELLADEPEVLGLVALLLLTDARRAARVGPDGELVLLEDQDRGRWDRSLIAEGFDTLARASRRRRPGPYQFQAAIAAVHAHAATPADTDWTAIATLYRELDALAPSPVVSLNRAVAVAMADGPGAGLALVDELAAGGELDAYQPFHAARADLLRRLGRSQEAAVAYEQALALTTNDAERSFLRRRLAEVRGTSA